MVAIVEPEVIASVKPEVAMPKVTETKTRHNGYCNLLFDPDVNCFHSPGTGL
jgi:hypothetical protein